MRLKLGTKIDLSERFVRLICQICQILISNDSMSYPRDFRDSEKNARRTDGPTTGPTDRRTDRPSYRDAWTHLKISICEKDLGKRTIHQNTDDNRRQKTDKRIKIRLKKLWTNQRRATRVAVRERILYEAWFLVTELHLFTCKYLIYRIEFCKILKWNEAENRHYVL